MNKTTSESTKSQIDDPIYAVLAEHRAATRAYLAASAISGALVDDTPEWNVAEAVTQAALTREKTATHAVLSVRPTTIAGAIALLDHVGQDQFLGEAEEDEFSDEDRMETVLSVRMNEEEDSDLKKDSLGFVRRLAETMRSLNHMHEKLDFADAFHTEITIARAIEAGLFGYQEIADEEMLEGVMRVQQLHIERLAGLKPRLDELFGINDWAPPEAATDERPNAPLPP